jgi:hypothetical protein
MIPESPDHLDHLDHLDRLALDVSEAAADRLLRISGLTGHDGRSVVEAERLDGLPAMVDREGAGMTINGTFPHEARPAAELYLRMGLAPIPLSPRSKKPGLNGWQDLRPTEADLDRLFPPGRCMNLGILNGEPSGNHHDVDLDCAEAVAAADVLLPPTGWIFGRSSKSRSHRIYVTDRPLGTAVTTYRDLDRTMLVELRGTGSLTVFPPSTHKETGEPITWQEFTAAAEVPLADLERAVAELAAAALVARHWPAKGSRDDTSMALAGGLLRAGWPVEQAERFMQAVVTAAGDDEPRERLRKPADTARKIEDGKPVTGWPRLAELLGEDGDQVVAEVRDWLGLADAAPADLPLPSEPSWPDPPAAEAFHGLAGRIVRTIEPASEADPAALLVQALVAFGNAAGRSAHFVVESDEHHGNEFVVLVGRTSKARKGTSWGRISRLFLEADEPWATERVQNGLSSGEGLIWGVRDPITKMERVKEKNKPVRYEEVEADPGVDDKRLLAYEPEFANVLKQTERQGNTLSVNLRQAWDGTRLQSLIKNSPARATGAHVSLIGHVTADELRRYLTVTETANGFGNRHLWVCAERSKVLPEGGAIDPAAWAALRGELVQSIAFARSAGEVTRDEEARAIWYEVYESLSEGKPGLAGALLGRAEAHVMRLAMLYALMDRSGVIKAEHLMAALALWAYAERSVYFVFGDALGDPMADDLLRLLRANPRGLTRTEIRDYFQRNASADRIGRALGLLLQHKLARFVREVTAGRPADRWYAAGSARP